MLVPDRLLFRPPPLQDHHSSGSLLHQPVAAGYEHSVIGAGNV